MVISCELIIAVPQGFLPNIKICLLGVQVNRGEAQQTTNDTKKKPTESPEVITPTVLTRARTKVKNRNGKEN